MALEWFKLNLLNTSDPANHLCWMDNWITFVVELQSTFSPHNPVTDAEHQLDHLQMKDGHCITWYIVDFNWLASQVQGYGDGALWHYFYTGLPDQIKDELSQIGKPWTLDGLHMLSRTKHIWYSEHGTYYQFEFILEQGMSATHVAVILRMRTGPAYEEEFMKTDYPDARNEYGTS